MQQSLRRYALLSLAAATATIGLKATAFLITGSVGLLSDALESTVNIAAALIALLALVAVDFAFGIRLWISILVRRAVAGLFGVYLHDANVPYKIFRRAIWYEARALIPRDTLIPSLFLAIFMRWNRYDVVELPVPHRQRRTGRVSIRGGKLLWFCLKAFRQLLTYRGRLKKATESTSEAAC